jgi:hypothetical protein
LLTQYLTIAKYLSPPKAIMKSTDLIQLTVTAPSADNSQPWQFVESPEGINCSYKDRTIKRDPFGPLGHGTLMSAGALLENINILCATQDQKTQLSLNASHWSITVPPSAWQHSLDSSMATLLHARHTNRHPFSSLPANSISELKHSFSARTLSLTNQESIKQLTKALTACSIARFNDHELHEWLFSSLRWTPAEVDSGTGLDFKTLHLPPGGKQFMQWIAPWERMKLLNRFGIYRILAAADSALFRQAPGVIAFVGGEAPEDILECGQLMQRTWLALNAQGIAVHPYYVLTDLSNRLRQKKLDERWSNKITTAQAIAAELLQLNKDEQVHMLFRIGTPLKTPVRSRRLPVATFIANDLGKH